MTRKLRASVSVIALLCGCATYDDLSRDGEPLTWTSTNTPIDVARCMRLHLLNGGAFVAEQLPMGPHGSEIVVRIGDRGSVVGSAKIEPDNGGSKINARITRGGVAPRVRAFFEGC